MSGPVGPSGFPRLVSFTLTNACRLRCGICGQWGERGYLHRPGRARPRELATADWCRLVGEVARCGPAPILLRGGEPFLHPGIVQILEAVRAAGLPLSIDTAGTELERYAGDLARLGGMHLTVSIDGPPAVHDRARGAPGTFERVERGLRALRAATEATGARLSLSLCCTIGPDTYRTLSELPDVARRLGIGQVTVVPYCHLSPELVRAQRAAVEALEAECPASPGFERAASGVDPAVLAEQLRRLREELRGIGEYPYMPLAPEEVRRWFTDPTAPVGLSGCRNVEHVLDVQPDGDADFCVDLVDYRLGNVRTSTLAELWRGERAERFRALLRRAALPACVRCVARYMGEQGVSEADPGSRAIA